MFKKLIPTLAVGAALAASSTAALAHGSWAFDDAYWKQLEHRIDSGTIGSRNAERYAAGPRETLTDAGGESRPSDSRFVTQSETEKARLNSAGFPQYTY